MTKNTFRQYRVLGKGGFGEVSTESFCYFNYNVLCCHNVIKTIFLGQLQYIQVKLQELKVQRLCPHLRSVKS